MTEYGVRQGSLTDQPVDALIVNLFEGVTDPGGGTGAVDAALGGALSEVISDERFTGKLGHTLVMRPCGSLPAKKVVLVGLGKSTDFGVVEILKASAAAARRCQSLHARTVGSILHGAGIAGLPAQDCARAVVLGAMLGMYRHTRLKTDSASETDVESFDIVELSADKIQDIERGMARARLVGDAVLFARDLVNEPSNVVTPEHLASVARDISAAAGMRCEVKNRVGIEEAGMGLLAAVSRGSEVEPRFIEIAYESPGAQRTIALIGKGITFDTGGYSLKTGDTMYGMKDDMAGAACVLAAMRAIGQVKPNVNVVGLIPATENCIGSSAIHPGDVFLSLGGLNVEINNTDAEGRLVLADAVARARALGVSQIIDLATLTGACVVALGRDLAGVFGNRQDMVNGIIEAGKSCGEMMWQLPLYSEYASLIKSDTADIKNTGGREAGAIVGALFIDRFVGDTPWVHIDLASAMAKKDNHLARKGATGVGAGAVIEYVLAAGEVQGG